MQITPPRPRLSIVIVSYNTRDITDQCLASIEQATWCSPYEVIVVDNNSSDGSVDMIAAKHPQVRLIQNRDNRLFAIANNQGVAEANGEYVLLLNSDTIVKGDNLQNMINYFDTLAEDVICVGPKVLNADGSLQSCGFAEWGNIFQHVSSLFHLNRLLPLHYFCAPLDRRPDVAHRTGWVVGACMMMRRNLYQKVGGLNERLVFYGEEPEFGFRSKRMGYKTLYWPGAEIIHLGGVSTSTDKAKKYSFEKDIAEYDSLVSETVGYRKAILITWYTRLSLKFKRLCHPNKAYFDSRIEHETKVIQYFKNKVTHTAK